MSIIRDIVEEHVEEIAFLWSQWWRSSRAPNYVLCDIQGIERRINYHVDGAVVAGSDLWDIATGALSLVDNGAAFTLTRFAIMLEKNKELAKILADVGDNLRLRHGTVSALIWPDASAESGPMRGTPSHHDEALLGPLLEAWAIAGVLSPDLLIPYLTDDPHPYKPLALRLAGEQGYTHLRPRVLAHVTSPVDSYRLSALYAGLLFKEPGLGAHVNEQNEKPDAIEMLAPVLLRSLPQHQARAWLQERVVKHGWTDAALYWAGLLGDAAILDAVVEAMSKPQFAVTAAASLALMTGLDMDKEELVSGDAESEPVVFHKLAGYDWPVPDRERVQGWWRNNRARFDDNQRYLMGHVVTPGNITGLLTTGNGWVRDQAAMEAKLIAPRLPLLNVSTPLKFQHSWLERFTSSVIT